MGKLFLIVVASMAFGIQAQAQKEDCVRTIAIANNAKYELWCNGEKVKNKPLYSSKSACQNAAMLYICPTLQAKKKQSNLNNNHYGSSEQNTDLAKKLKDAYGNQSDKNSKKTRGSEDPKSKNTDNTGNNKKASGEEQKTPITVAEQNENPKNDEKPGNPSIVVAQNGNPKDDEKPAAAAGKNQSGAMNPESAVEWTSKERKQNTASVSEEELLNRKKTNDKNDADDSKNRNKKQSSASGTNGIEKQHAGEYGGFYGGVNTENTKAANAAIDAASNLAAQVGGAITSNQAGKVQAELIGQGAKATTADYYHSEAKILRSGAKTSNRVAHGVMAGAAVQAYLGYRHQNSVKRVNRSADAANKQFANDPDKINTIENNRSGEVAAQKDAVMIQAVSMAATASKGAAMYAAAKMAKKTADVYDKMAGETAVYQSNLNFNPKETLTLPEDEVTAPAPEQNAIVADENLGDEGLDTGLEDFNPNPGDNTVAGPAPGAFNPSSGAGGGGAAGPGPGGAGGTSAAKDDGSAKPEGMAMKSQAGSYSAGEGGGPRFSRASAGPNVGTDNSLADLLKKFLPGGEEDKLAEKKELAQEDRMPASDAAAVLGRNTNIFDAIHKRYEKKHNEGAIIFLGDRS